MRVANQHSFTFGRVVNTLWGLYEPDRPKPFEKAGLNLEEVGLEKLKNFGL